MNHLSRFVFVAVITVVACIVIPQDVIAAHSQVHVQLALGGSDFADDRTLGIGEAQLEEEQKKNATATPTAPVEPLIKKGETIHLEVPFGDTLSVTGLADYLSKIYIFIVSTIGIISAVMIMVHGIQWSIAGGNSDIVGKAKEGIMNAVIALFLAFGSYMILYIINPQLTTFAEPDLPVAQVREDALLDDSGIAADAKNCEEANLINYQETVLNSEPAKSVISWSSQGSLPCINQSGITALKEVARLLNDPNAGWDDAGTFRNYKGMKLKINSGFRAAAQQEHLYACYQQKLQSGTCSAVNGKGCGACNEAAKPGTSLHESGKALDVTWEAGPGADYISNAGYAKSTFHDACLVQGGTPAGCSAAMKKSITGLDKMMQDAGFNRICVEWWHFQIGGTSTCEPGVWRS